MARQPPLPLPRITLVSSRPERSHTQGDQQGGPHPQRRLRDPTSTTILTYTTSRYLTCCSGAAISLCVRSYAAAAGRPPLLLLARIAALVVGAASSAPRRRNEQREVAGSSFGDAAFVSADAVCEPEDISCEHREARAT